MISLEVTQNDFTFATQCQVYRVIGFSLLTHNIKNQFLQINFKGSEEEEINKGCAIFQQVNSSMKRGLQGMLHQRKDLIKTFCTALEMLSCEDYKVVINLIVLLVDINEITTLHLLMR